ncbi:putative carboxypeptidase [Gregarina niphandrodes]|uniref:Carboxypeptidase n=1 Tax=Gregarina niphandrodes TaxID=110365 RepID=A0A023BBU6_GRENI|nr:putative carboxypeptidase [Gregarina niphandrodes]EZG81179.1 putative carboxypeptidase [Gregarina niphandrodes]|eukprot:XP_011134237.1 putative carboxypeptidase [Gregarina niphandrodes]
MRLFFLWGFVKGGIQELFNDGIGHHAYGFPSYEEVFEALDHLEGSNPLFITKIPIGLSYQCRVIWSYLVSTKGIQDPKVYANSTSFMQYALMKSIAEEESIARCSKEVRQGGGERRQQRDFLWLSSHLDAVDRFFKSRDSEDRVVTIDPASPEVDASPEPDGNPQLDVYAGPDGNPGLDGNAGPDAEDPENDPDAIEENSAQLEGQQFAGRGQSAPVRGLFATLSTRFWRMPWTSVPRSLTSYSVTEQGAFREEHHNPSGYNVWGYNPRWNNPGAYGPRGYAGARGYGTGRPRGYRPWIAPGRPTSYVSSTGYGGSPGYGDSTAPWTRDLQSLSQRRLRGVPAEVKPSRLSVFLRRLGVFRQDPFIRGFRLKSNTWSGPRVNSAGRTVEKVEAPAEAQAVADKSLWLKRLDVFGYADRGRVLMTALHHAREPTSLTASFTVFYGIVDSLNKLALDPAVGRSDPEDGLVSQNALGSLMSGRDIVFVPFVNPDGYRAIELTRNPMIRKNQRPTCTNNPTNSTALLNGIDLNRNYGSTFVREHSPCHTEEYEGTHAFSEPETRAIRRLTRLFRPQIALNFHAYGDLWTRPWNCCSNRTLSRRDKQIFTEIAQSLHGIESFGSAPELKQLGYVATGESDDWMMEEYGTISMSPEIGPEEHEFYPKTFSVVKDINRDNFNRTINVITKAGSELNMLLELCSPRRNQLSIVNSGLMDTGHIALVYSKLPGKEAEVAAQLIDHVKVSTANQVTGDQVTGDQVIDNAAVSPSNFTSFINVNVPITDVSARYRPFAWTAVPGEPEVLEIDNISARASFTDPKLQLEEGAAYQFCVYNLSAEDGDYEAGAKGRQPEIQVGFKTRRHVAKSPASRPLVTPAVIDDKKLDTRNTVRSNFGGQKRDTGVDQYWEGGQRASLATLIMGYQCGTISNLGCSTDGAFLYVPLSVNLLTTAQ